MYIIAADVGGTKTRLMLADVDKADNVLYEKRYQCEEFDSFEQLLRAFINESELVKGQVDILTLALPGLVSETSASLTNLPWVIEKQFLKDSFGFKNVYFMNDFQASALGTIQLPEKDRVILNSGRLNSNGLKDNVIRVAVGAGTGLGVAWIQSDLTAVHAYDTEGGHIDFAPVNETQIELLQFLQQSFAHVSYERLLSGSGLVRLYEFCAGKAGINKSANINAEWVNNQSENDQAAGRALSLFVQIYGAYVGNIALLFKPSGGIFITGGIAAKILKKMQSEEFINAYLDKGRMSALVEQIAVYLVTNERIGVLGAMSETMKMQRESTK